MGTPDRYNKVQDNFFSQGANAKNASESATPGLTDFANKTLYLLEELPKGKLYTSKIKQITSKDDARGRALHQGHQTIKFIGKLLINANDVPQLGEESPVWDRAVFIPFDTRYVCSHEDPDPSKFRLVSDNAKKDRIISLTSAFMTVCLKELHKFISNYKKDHNGIMPTNLNMPACVIELIEKEKEKAFPLKVFIKNYTREQLDSKHTTSTDFFNAFRGFCRIRNIRSSDTMDNIIDKLPRAGIQTCTTESDEMVILDRVLTEKAITMAEREAINTRQIDIPNPDSYPINRGFKRQRENDEFINYQREADRQHLAFVDDFTQP